MRYISFELGQDDDAYGIIINGIPVSKRPMDWDGEPRVISTIQDKFEKLGRPEKMGDVVMFTLKENGVVALEDAEYELLLALLKGVQWAPAHARRVSKARDMLVNPPAVEPGPRTRPKLVAEPVGGG